jgi:hypothetical protein
VRSQLNARSLGVTNPYGYRMTTPFLRLSAVRRSGAETVHADGRPVGGTLLEFWQWSASDLVSNATRGRLAEYLVHRAVGSPEQSVRDEWDAFDLTTPEGTRVEVKSAAYVQSWHQERLSSIVFRTPKTRAWSADTNRQEAEARRQAQVYVFALLHHTDKPSVDPLNVRQWTFYVLPTRVLDARTRSQDSITLTSLQALCGQATPFEEISRAIRQAARAA